jgi:hypothetical protein
LQNLLEFIKNYPDFDDIVKILSGLIEGLLGSPAKRTKPTQEIEPSRWLLRSELFQAIPNLTKAGNSTVVITCPSRQVARFYALRTNEERALVP